jgi:Na+/H+-translocating membrane pyrophosphatase
MRGGSLPQLAWGGLLALFLVICWIWTGDTLQVGEFGFAVAVTWGSALVLALRSRREALHRGAPESMENPQAMPTSSLGTVLVAIAFACILFGFAFGRFLVFFGGGLMITALGMVAHERIQERRAVSRWVERERTPR